MRYIRLKLVFFVHNATSLKLILNIRSKTPRMLYRFANVHRIELFKKYQNVILMYFMVFGKCNTNTQGLKIAKKHHELQNQLLIKILPFYKTTLFLSLDSRQQQQLKITGMRFWHHASIHHVIAVLMMHKIRTLSMKFVQCNQIDKRFGRKGTIVKLLTFQT